MGVSAHSTEACPTGDPRGTERCLPTCVVLCCAGTQGRGAVGHAVTRDPLLRLVRIRGVSHRRGLVPWGRRVLPCALCFVAGRARLVCCCSRVVGKWGPLCGGPTPRGTLAFACPLFCSRLPGASLCACCSMPGWVGPVEASLARRTAKRPEPVVPRTT